MKRFRFVTVFLACAHKPPASTPQQQQQKQQASCAAAGCDANATCDATSGTPVCTCKTGYDGSGKTCTAIACVPGSANCGTNTSPARLFSMGDGTCEIRDDGTLWCWGQNEEGIVAATTAFSVLQPTQLGTNTWLAVSGSTYHACGIDVTRAAFCWGGDAHGDLGNGTPGVSVTTPTAVTSTAKWQALVTGTVFTCGLSSGALFCWGEGDELGRGSDTSDQSTPAPVGTDTDWTSLTAGNYFACALKQNGTLWCWGSAEELGQPAAVTAPLQIGGDNDWLSIAASSYNTCGLKSSGAIWCFGVNVNGESGQPPGAVTSPTQVGSDTDYVSVYGGGGDQCGAKSDGSLYCWGNGDHGELGPNASASTNVPALISGPYADLAIGDTFMCATTSSGSHACWGRGFCGRWGDGAGSDSPVPTAIDSTESFASVFVGGDFACAYDSTNNATACWGNNFNGQLGVGDTLDRQAPVALPLASASSDGWADVRTGSAFACGIETTTGHLYCWGSGANGELAVGDGEQHSPMLIDASDWKHLALGASHGCGGHDSSTYCWGYNSEEQVGSTCSSSNQQCNITAVTGVPSPLLRPGAGNFSSCAISDNASHKDELYCWGYNADGELGTGDITDESAPTPTASAGVSTYFALAMSILGNHGCAIQNDNTASMGSLYCWGGNAAGQLGTGDTNSRSTPTQVITGSDDNTFTAVAAGYDFTCAIKNSDTLWCWGDNLLGTLGRPSTGTFDSTPGQVTGNFWHTVAAGSDSACAINASGQVFCWGDNDDGGLGTNNAWSATPVAVKD